MSMQALVVILASAAGAPQPMRRLHSGDASGTKNKGLADYREAEFPG
jgi:hypothetical protein